MASVPIGIVIWGVRRLERDGPFEAPGRAAGSGSAGEGNDQARLGLQDVGDTDGSRVVELAGQHGRVHERRPGLTADEAHAVGAADGPERVAQMESPPGFADRRSRPRRRTSSGATDQGASVSMKTRDCRAVSSEAGVAGAAADGDRGDDELVGVPDHVDVVDDVQLGEASDVDRHVGPRDVNRAGVAGIGAELVDVEEVRGGRAVGGGGRRGTGARHVSRDRGRLSARGGGEQEEGERRGGPWTCEWEISSRSNCESAG